MGYTRYNYKPRKKPGKNFLTIGIAGILLAIVIGLLIGKVLFKGNNAPNSDQANAIEGTEQSGTIDTEDKDNSNKEGADKDVSAKVTETGDKKRFSMIQCGYYGKKENAEKVLNDIPSTYNKFIIEEDGKFRVIAGIYTEDAVSKVSDQLTEKEIANVKINCEYELSDTQNSMIYEIITGFMKILNELENEQVKSVNTTDFKKWTSELGKDSKDKTENDELKNLREHIEKLPKELNRDGAKKSLEFIYKMLIKHRV